MAKHLHRELESLEGRLMALAALAEDALVRGGEALRTRNVALAAEIIAADVAIDALENQIQEECLKTLALYQPVAADLRRVAAVFSITTDLERIGDLAVEIARSVPVVSAGTLPTPPRIDRLIDVVVTMLRQAIDAFVQLESRQAARVVRLDDEADRLHAEVITELIAAMKSDSTTVEAGMALFNITRHLERVGDHATNIAEDVVYIVEGETIRHRPEALNRDTPNE